METGAITPQTARPFLEQPFGVSGHPVEITLVEVDERDSGDPNHLVFSLLFEGPAETQLGQGMWDLDCDGEAFSLFLVPIGPQPSGRYGYEAAFSVQS